MKQTIRILLFIVLVTLMSVPLSCFFVDKIYYVVFEERPVLLDERVFYDGEMIGRIESQKLRTTENNEIIVILEIFIEEKHEHMMTDKVIFYVDKGRLIYDTIGDTGKSLSRKAKIIGFKTKTVFHIFKAKNKQKNLSETAVQKAKELYDKAY